MIFLCKEVSFSGGTAVCCTVSSINVLTNACFVSIISVNESGTLFTWLQLLDFVMLRLSRLSTGLKHRLASRSAFLDLQDREHPGCAPGIECGKSLSRDVLVSGFEGLGKI